MECKESEVINNANPRWKWEEVERCDGAPDIGRNNRKRDLFAPLRSPLEMFFPLTDSSLTLRDAVV